MSYSPIYYNPQDAGPSSAVITPYTNASVSVAIPQAMCVSVNNSGLVTPLNVASQSSVNNLVGYANVRIPASTNGQIISSGRLLNYTTGLTIGTPLYVGTDGNPTNIVPSVGVNGFLSGYYVIFLGVLVANETSGIDIALFTQVIGTL